MPVLGPRVISPIPNLFFVINDLPRCWMDDARRESGRRRAAGCDVTTSWKVAVGSRTCGGPVAVWGPLPFPYGAMEVAKTMKGPCDRSIGEIGPLRDHATAMGDRCAPFRRIPRGASPYGPFRLEIPENAHLTDRFGRRKTAGIGRMWWRLGGEGDLTVAFWRICGRNGGGHSNGEEIRGTRRCAARSSPIVLTLSFQGAR